MTFAEKGENPFVGGPTLPIGPKSNIFSILVPVNC
jgi:hypothetical protein